MSLTIGVDVGGTKIAAGVVDEKGAIIEMVKRPTPAANASRTIEEISEAVRELLPRYEIEAVGSAAGGLQPRRAPLPGVPPERRSGCCSFLAEHRKASPGGRSRPPRGKVTPPRCAASTSSAGGWGRGWRIWPRFSTPAVSCSAAAYRRPVTC